jgi:RNA polymerase sigma factor (TIGR02999 family)
MAERVPTPRDVTRLLQRWSGGQRDALDPLFTLVYNELRQMARGHLAREGRNHTLAPTELVHEAFGRLVVQDVSWQNRAHFFGIAAQCMRRILVDHARRKHAAKRPSSDVAVEVAEDAKIETTAIDKILMVDEALRRLERVNPRQTQIVELKYFGDLTIDEIAEVVGVSPATVKRDWEEAKRWLLEILSAQKRLNAATIRRRMRRSDRG